MRSAPLLFLATVLPLAASLGCAPGPAETDGEYATEKKGVVCAHTAADPTQVLNRLLHDRPGALDSNGNAILTNFTAWPSYDPDSNSATIDPKVIAARTDAKDARANLASRFGDCSGKVETHLAKSKPNVYVYFTGYGGPNQNNSVIQTKAGATEFRDLAFTRKNGTSNSFTPRVRSRTRSSAFSERARPARNAPTIAATPVYIASADRANSRTSDI